MKLYLIHCGFYDTEVCEGLYESHANFFIAAPSSDAARAEVKKQADFIKKRMHVDGLQEIQAVNGYRVQLEPNASLQNQTIITNFKHRDLAEGAT
jgi:hypothetical protein